MKDIYKVAHIEKDGTYHVLDNDDRVIGGCVFTKKADAEDVTQRLNQESLAATSANAYAETLDSYVPQD